MITIALAKGYLLQEAVRRFEALGITFQDDLMTTRKLFTLSNDGQLRILQVRPWDVPVYVANGAADIGIAGLDVLAEQLADVLQLLDLKFGGCQLVLAGPRLDIALTHQLRIATKYPHLCEEYFYKKGLKVELLKLYGAIELAPLTGLADLICDLTATGRTLAENNLFVLDTVMTSTARLIANPSLFRLNYDQIMQLTTQLAKVTQ